MVQTRNRMSLPRSGRVCTKDRTYICNTPKKVKRVQRIQPLKHKPNETLLLRSGAFKMRQLFRLQETTNGHYESLYGMFGSD